MTLRRNINNVVIVILVAVFGAALCSSAPAVQPWEEDFFNPCPETRGPWTFSTQKLKTDKGMQWGWIPGAVGNFQTEKGAWRSYGENESSLLWTGAHPRNESGESYRPIGGFSMSNDIGTWLAPPEGATRNIKFSLLEEFPGLNNVDIFEVDENQVAASPLIFGAQTDPPSNNLGIVDPYKGADRNVTGLEYKTDLAPDRFKYNHTQAIHNGFGKYITAQVLDQTGENIYCSLSKTGKFSASGELVYGAHAYMASLGGEFMWGSENGSGYASAAEAVFDQQGEFSGEYFNSKVSMNSNGRWWGEITKSGLTYQLYLEDADGSIKPYEESTYPEDPVNPLDPEAASGYPVRWHDAYEVQETYGIDLSVTEYGEEGGYLAERGENIFWEVHQSEVHEADVLGEVRTFDPHVNDDGPESPYNWVYDGSGDMYIPQNYWDGSSAPTAYAGQWDSDTAQERAAHLIGIKGSWTELNETTSDPATPPDGEHDWECMGETSPGSGIYDWRTFEGYSGVDQHPFYQNDDHGSSWTDWAWDPGSETWLDTNYESDLEDDDWKIGVNSNGGIVEQTVFEHAWRLAELMLYSNAEDRPFEDLGYVWNAEEGCVAEIVHIENDLLNLGFSLKLPLMSWNGTANAWEFPDNPDNAGYYDIWGFLDHDAYSPMEGFELINNFIRYVFDIDSVVVQDVNGDGHFDPGVDYILFSLVDDGLYDKMLGWDNQSGGVIEETLFQGQYFDGDTIFLYDGYSVITYFDPATNIFFGEYETLDSTLWAGYELDALDIGLTGVIPEPSTMILLIGAGLALGTGVIRKKLR